MTAHLKHTKIVATIGPKTESQEMLTRLMQAGMNVIRLNMSHGDHEEHGARIVNGRRAAAELGTEVGILLDLAGPKIRTGSYETDRITIEEGSQLVLTTEECVGNTERIFVNYPKLALEVNEGSIVMLDDGKKKLLVEKIVGNDIHCRVLIGGELKSRRGVNVPGAYLSIDTITEKDRKDIAFGIAGGVDIIALSFVRRAQDVVELKQILADLGAPTIPVISKIETQEAMDTLDAILEVSDGAMVARGDLAIEVPAENVPRYQKEIISKCNALGKPVITATQMMESMITNPVPTRAEISDVANAVYDGTDAVMLSEESTLGAFPVEAVEMMARVAGAAEKRDSENEPLSVASTVTLAAAQAAEDLSASVIVVLTESGTTARDVARANPTAHIVALTSSLATARQLALTRGVTAHKIEPVTSLDGLLASMPAFLTEHDYARTGDVAIITAGLNFGYTGATNFLLAITV